MKNLFKTISLIASMLLLVLSTSAKNNIADSSRIVSSKDAQIPSYSKCFYVSFCYCKDGVTHTGYLGSKCALGTPNYEGLRIHIAMQVGCIPNDVILKDVVPLCNADYNEQFKGHFGKVLIHANKII